MTKLTKKKIEEIQMRKEKVEQKKKYFVFQYEKFLLWHKYDAVTIVEENDPLRMNAVSLANKYLLSVFYKVEHRCDETPKGVKIWCNTVASLHNNEYWVLNYNSVRGTHIEKCPYCGADLQHQKGRVVLFKTKFSDEEWQKSFDRALED